jgi:hypothetical protein
MLEVKSMGGKKMRELKRKIKIRKKVLKKSI